MTRFSRLASLFGCLVLWTGCGAEEPVETLPDSGVVITVDGGGTETDGGAIDGCLLSASTRELDFGTAVLQTSVTRTLTLTNDPSAMTCTLGIDDLIGPSADMFAVTPLTELQ